MPTNTWFADGPVYAVAARGSTVYLAGSFTRIGRKTGMLTLLDRVSGDPDLSFARLEGGDASGRTDIVADGQGGYIVAGPFRRADGVLRQGLVRITPAGRVDPGFVPVFEQYGPGPNVAVVGHRAFTTVYRDGAVDLVALDISTGQQIFRATPDWLNGDSQLYEGPGNTLLVLCDHVLRSLDAATGVLRWSTAADIVSVDGAIGAIARRYDVFRIDLAIGVTSPLVTASGTLCSPVTPFICRISSLTLYQKRVYLIGTFDTVAGVTRQGAAAVDFDSGTVLPWSAPVLADHSGPLRVWGDGDRVLVLYRLTTALGRTLVALDSFTSEQTGWRGHLMGGDADASVELIAEPTRLVVVGRFWGGGGVARAGLAAVAWPDGAPTAWNPDRPEGVFTTLAVSGSRLFAGSGSRLLFDSGVAGRLVEIDAETGGARVIADVSPATIQALHVAGTRLYVGGSFQQSTGSPRSGLASLDLSGPSPTLEPWGPRVETEPLHQLVVSDIVTMPGAVMFSGAFWRVNGEFRTGIGAVDPITGTTLTWRPPLVYAGAALEVTPDLLWLSGRFGQHGFDYRGDLVREWPPRGGPLSATRATTFGEFLYVGPGYAVHRATGLVSDWRLPLRENFAGGRWTPAGALGLVLHDALPHYRGGFAFYPRVSNPGSIDGLHAEVASNTVNLSWSAAEGATSYLIAAGSTPGSDDQLSIDTHNSVTSFSTNAADGVYYVRVRAIGDGGAGPVSKELRIALGPESCAAPPEAPEAFRATVTGANVLLQWTASPGGTGGRFFAQVGRAPGRIDAVIAAGTATTLYGAVPPGTYYARVIAENNCGDSTPSNEVAIVVR